MREDLKSKLDAELKRSRKKNALLILLPFIGFAILVSSLVPLSTIEIAGVTERRGARPSEFGDLPRAIVELEGGKVVRARMPRQLPFKPNANVVLQQSNTLIGIKRYRIVRYVEDGT